MPIPVELLRFFDRGSGQTSPYAGDLPVDTGEAEVAAAEAAIEHKPLPPEAAIAQEETLAIPPVAPIPASAVAAGQIPEPEIPQPDVPDPVIPEAQAPEPRLPGSRGPDPSGNGAADQTGSA
jgi:hypothetical protein